MGCQCTRETITLNEDDEAVKLLINSKPNGIAPRQLNKIKESYENFENRFEENQQHHKKNQEI